MNGIEKLFLALDDKEAMALAQFIKRLTWTEMRACARRLGIFLLRPRLPSRSSSSILLCASLRTAPRRLLSTIWP